MGKTQRSERWQKQKVLWKKYRPKGLKNTICDSICNLVKVLIKCFIIFIVVNKAGFYKYGRHFCPFEYNKVRTFGNSKIFKASHSP